MVNNFPLLTYSSPAAQGMSRRAIEGFVTAWEELAAVGRSEPHSFMLLRHGRIVAEGWWSPYRPDAPQNLYSVSKTFAALAIGFAAAEQRLELDDPVIKFFPAKLPEAVSPNLAAMRVRDLLTMATGHPDNMTWPMMMQPDWVAAFLGFEAPGAPGTNFIYDSSASYMLSAIIQTISGMKLIDYLEPRLFEPLGVRGHRWAECPMGMNTGGWGFSATTETIAKTGQLFLQRGMWNGVQLLPAEFMDEASASHIQQSPNWVFWGAPDPHITLDQLRATSDYYQGYGFQIWRGRHDSYRADGALAQFMIVLPEQNAVIAMTSESPDWQGLHNLIWEKLMPAFAGKDEADSDDTPLRFKRELPRPAGLANPNLEKRLAGVEYALDPNALQAERIAFAFDGDTIEFRMVHNGSVTTLKGSQSGWLDGSTNMPGTPPDLFGIPMSAATSAVATAVAWTSPDTLVFKSCFYETPHHDTLTCSFEGDVLEVRFLNSLSVAFGATDENHPFAERRPVLRGLPG